MPRREIGLMGYVGETVVAYWLEKVRHPDCKTVPQIMPAEYPRKGGPYLDFGVIKDEKVHAIYEVKSQDFILDGGINGALAAIRNNEVRDSDYSIQDDPDHQVKTA